MIVRVYVEERESDREIITHSDEYFWYDNKFNTQNVPAFKYFKYFKKRTYLMIKL